MRITLLKNFQLRTQECLDFIQMQRLIILPTKVRHFSSQSSPVPEEEDPVVEVVRMPSSRK